MSLISRLGELGKWDVIKKNFENMNCRGTIYAILGDIYGQYGRFQDAENCISALKSEGLLPSAGMFCVLANAYAQQVLCPISIFSEFSIIQSLFLFNFFLVWPSIFIHFCKR